MLGAPPLRDLVGHLVDRLVPDRQDAKPRARFQIPPERSPSEEQRQEGMAELLEQAAAPLAGNPALRETLLNLRQGEVITVDVLTSDALRFAGIAAHACRS